MTIHELEQYLSRYAVPYSRITVEGKKVDAEGSARKFYDKKSSNKQIVALRLWLGQRADKRYVCWHSGEQKIVLISEYLMPCLNDASLTKDGSVDVKEINGIEYFLDETAHKSIEFGWQERLAELYSEYTK